MYDRCTDTRVSKFFIRILYIGFFSMIGNFAKAECVPNQNEVPVCLSGTAIAPDYSGAVIQESGQPGLRQVIPGDMVESWTIGEIGTRYIILERGTRAVRLELSNLPTANATAQSADEAPLKPTVKHGLRHPRSLARGGE